MKTKLLLALIVGALCASCCPEEKQPESSEDQNSGDFIDRSEYDRFEFQRRTAQDPEQVVPKAQRVWRAQVLRTTVVQPISAHYDVSKRAIVTSAFLDSKLGGQLKGFGQHIINRCREAHICPLFVVAVMQHESDNGTSKYAREYNNVAGIMKGSKPVVFDDVQSCIDYTVNLLSNNSYAGKSRKTIAKIQTRYCPVGAANDPNSLNQHWLGGVQAWMQRTFGAKEVYCLSK